MSKPIQSIHATRVPAKHTASHRASEYIHQNGPILRADLFAAVNFGQKSFNRNSVLDRAIATGWLIERGNFIDISKMAYDFHEGVEKPAAPTGIPAARREFNAYEQPPLSRKYLTSSRGTRADIPAWSQRGSDHHFFTVA